MKIFSRVMPAICVFMGMVCIIPANGQPRRPDNVMKSGEEQVLADPSMQLFGKSSGYSGDSATVILQEALHKAQQEGDVEGQKKALIAMAFRYRILSRYDEAIMAANRGIQLLEKKKDTLGLFTLYRAIWFSYIDLNDTALVNYYRDKVIQLYESGYLQRNGPESNLKRETIVYYNLLASRYRNAGDLDSSNYYTRLIYNHSIANHDNQWLGIMAHRLFRDLSNDNSKQDSVLYFGRLAINASIEANRNDNAGKYMIALVKYFQRIHLPDSALLYAERARRLGLRTERKILQLEASKALYELNTMLGRKDSTLFYINEWAKLNDELFGQDKINLIQQLNIKEKIRQEAEVQEALLQKEKMIANTKLYALLAIAVAILALAIFYYRNGVQKKKANLELQRAYSDLKATQAQLIQTEKMASLGELTAGIAHEIQNPLNFVNNFSEINTELIDEAAEEINNGNISEVKTMLQDIKNNEQKINHHGKRADAIVKGMLQHSGSSSGIKEPTDINALCDEYLRLSYHGLRAKDKTFNATIPIAIGTDFDESIGNINIIPQDIGRVILNLITNAFYVVNEKTLSAVSTPTAVKYEPTVKVSTKKINDKVEIKVSDNGNGIPQNVLDKIFQPFFTTKPTGQGTGLGLSLSYDIVKAHGGDITVDTTEGKGSEFTILLPV